MKFLTEIVEIEERKTYPNIWDIKFGEPMPLKHEEIILKVKLISSGDTRKFSSEEIANIVLKKIIVIEPNAI